MHSDVVSCLNDRPTIEYGVAGARLSNPGDAFDIIGAALQRQAQPVILPVARIAAGFFDLKTGLAGAALQKFVNYGVSLAIVGVLPAGTARSEALRAFMDEANRGGSIWFVETRRELARRLSSS